jgi:hypothetical protein
MPMEFIVPSLHMVALTKLTKEGTVEKRLSDLMELEEYHFFTCFHQQVQKAHEKYLHDRHIKQKKFQKGDLLLLYDSKFLQHPRKFKMHWLGTYVIRFMTGMGFIHLEKLNGEDVEGLVNGIQLKLYRGSRAFAH